MAFLLLAMPPADPAAGNVCTSSSPCACGPNCNYGYETSNNYSTIDSCADGPDFGYEYVHDITLTDLNDSVFSAGDLVQVDAYLDCDLDGDEISFAYNNGSGWKNIGDTTCSIDGKAHRYLNFTLEDIQRYHTVRVITAYSGVTGMTCGYDYDRKYSDSDDLSFFVLGSIEDNEDPGVRILGPAPGSAYLYVPGLMINITANVTDNSQLDSITANVSWALGSRLINMTNASGIFHAFFTNITSDGRHNVTITARDHAGNSNGTETTYFFINVTSNITVYSPADMTILPSKPFSLFYKLKEGYDADRTWYVIDDADLYYNKDILTQGFSSSDAGDPDYVSSTNRTNITQSFILPADTDASMVSLRMMKNGTGAENALLQIRTDQDGHPSITALAYANISADLVPSGGLGWVNLTLNGTAELSAGSRYWLFISANASASDFYSFETNSGDAYSKGNLTGNLTRDLLFQVYDKYRYNTTLSLDQGDHYLQVFANSTSQPDLQSSIVSFEIDYHAPIVNDVILDGGPVSPGTVVNVTADVTDNLGLSYVFMYYVSDVTAFEWPNKTMVMSGGRYYANFTPDIEANWSILIDSYDTSDNEYASDEYIIESAYKRGWSVTPEAINSTGIAVASNASLGTLTIRNDADFDFAFNISTNVNSSILSLNGTDSIITYIPKRGSANISLVGFARPYTYEDEISIAIYALNSTADPQEAYIDFTLVSFIGTAYLHADIVEYSTPVTQGDHIPSIMARITNMGTSSVHDVTASWTLPPGWTSRDDLNETLGDLNPGGIDAIYYKISADVGDEASAGDYTLMIKVNCSEGSSDSDTRLITVDPASPPQDNDEPKRSGGGGSPSGPSGAPIVIRAQPFNISVPDIQLARGEGGSIAATIRNNYPRPIGNITLSLEGLFRNYYNITPEAIGSLEDDGTAYIVINITAPQYLAAGMHELALIANASGIGEPMRTGFMLVIADSNISVGYCLEESSAYLESLRSYGIDMGSLEDLYQEAEDSYARKEFDRAEEICTLIREDYQSAQYLQGEIISVERTLLNYSSEGYNISSTWNALALAKEAYLRGDFETSKERMQQAGMIASLERIGQDSPIRAIIRFINDYALHLLLLIIIVSLVLAISKEYLRSRYIKGRIQSLSGEQEEITSLIKELQKEHFVERIIPDSLYARTLEDYRKRLSRNMLQKLHYDTYSTEFILRRGQKALLADEHGRIVRLIGDIQDMYYNKKVIDYESYDFLLKEYEGKKALIEAKIGPEKRKPVPPAGDGKLDLEWNEDDEKAQEMAPRAQPGPAQAKEGIQAVGSAVPAATGGVEPGSGKVDIDAKAGEDKAFITSYGKKIYTARELAEEMAKMKEEQYHLHANGDKNDFARWIQEVYNYASLAKGISSSGSREEAIRSIYENAK